MSTSRHSQSPINFRWFLQLIQRCAAVVLSWSTITWVLIGFCAAFGLYFIVPTFLSAYHELRLFSGFPALQPLGADLHEYLNFSKHWVENGTPYIPPNYYPPFQALFFFRFMQSGPQQSFVYVTVLSLLSFLASVWLYPTLVVRGRQLKALALFGIITGLFSYGLWFQLERGQFDLMVMAFCLAGIYLYHHHPRWRWAAYILFVLSVNLKIYPAIFVVCFTTDWRKWVENIRRWGLLVLASVGGFIILGWQVFLDFVRALLDQMNQPSYWWVGNHSINSFLRLVAENWKKTDPNVYALYRPNMRWVELVLILIYLVCLFVVLCTAYRREMSAANPYLLLVLTLGTMLIPSTSHDYKLSILVAPMVLLLNAFDLHRSDKPLLDGVSIVLWVLISFFYSATLFLHADLPELLANNMPILMGLTIFFTILLRVRDAQSHRCANPVVFEDLQ